MSAPAWIDLGRGSEETLPIADFYHFIVGDLAISSAGDYLEQIPVRPNRRLGYVTQLKARHVALRDRIVHPVDLYVELVMIRVMLLYWLFRFVAHVSSSRDVVVSRYHTTAILDKSGGLVVQSEI
jgi:hypothetical protein